MESEIPPSRILPSLDLLRTGLQTPPRRRVPMWMLLLVASFAAVAGVSAAAVMILGPGGQPAVRSAPIAP